MQVADGDVVEPTNDLSSGDLCIDALRWVALWKDSLRTSGTIHTMAD
jgi:hypothetical protein